MKAASVRTIVHIDMDAFYASVEMLDNTTLRTLPVIVGGSGKRGVVSAASYEARKFGVHSAMPLVQAKKLCPHGVFLPVRMARYQEISRRIMGIFCGFTPLVEPISLDEAFLDVSASNSLYGSGEEIALCIKQSIKEQIGLTASAGVATSKLLAKIASDMQKPDGLTIVPPGREEAFLAPLPIEKLWGAGHVTCKKLHMLGVHIIGDLARLPRQLLEKQFGKLGNHLYHSCRGEDTREVSPLRQIKSLGNEETFEQDISSRNNLEKEMLYLAVKVGERLRHKKLKARTISIKVKLSDFQQLTRAVTLELPTADDREIYKHSVLLLHNALQQTRPVRLLGITLSGLESSSKPEQLPLFSRQAPKKNSDLFSAVDAINRKFGSSTLRPGRLIKD